MKQRWIGGRRALLLVHASSACIALGLVSQFSADAANQEKTENGEVVPGGCASAARVSKHNWLAWAPTGAEIWRVDDAGELRIDK